MRNDVTTNTAKELNGGDNCFFYTSSLALYGTERHLPSSLLYMAVNYTKASTSDTLTL